MAKTQSFWSQDVGGNLCLNGNFDLWARGTSSAGGGTYLADRWIASAGCEAYSRGTATPPSGSLYYAIYTRTTASSSTLVLFQRIESANTKMLDGKTVTLSFQFRQTAGTTTACKIRVDSANAVDNFAAITTQIAETTVLASPTASWQSVSYTFAVNSTMATNGIQIVIGNLTTTGPVTFNIAQVKLEVGASATPFSLAGGNIAGEELLCARYYQRFFQNTAVVPANSTGNADFRLPLKTKMRASPAVQQISGTTLTNALDKVGSATYTPTSIGFFSITANSFEVSFGGSYTLYQPIALITDIIEASAEL